MERTTSSFLELGQPKGRRPLLEEHGASCADAALFLPTSGILRPVPSKLPVQKQQFMSFKSVQEDGFNSKLHGDARMSGFHSVAVPMGVSDANNHRAAAPTPQKTLNKAMQQGSSYSSFLNLTNKHSFPLPSHPSRAANSTSPQLLSNVHLTNYPYGLPVVPAKGHAFVGPPQTQSPFAGHYPPATVQHQQRAVGAPGFEAPLACPPNVGYNTRNSSQPLPTSGQLTIFFGGMVNVYENVSLEKVHAILSMAANGSNITPENSNASKQVPLIHPGRVRPADPVRVKPSEAMIIRHPQPQAIGAASPYSGLCSPTSAVASPSVDHSASSSSTPDEPTGSKSSVPPENRVSVEDEPATQTTPMSRAVPMARKASLARFLEKRKERISCLAPYASAQKPSDGSLGIKAMSSFIENHTAKLINATGAREQPWHPARAGHGTDANFVNTELGI